MAETVADSGHLSLEDDTNFLEIDFEDADGALLDTNELKPTGGEQEPAAVANDVDFHIDEFEVVDDAGEQSGNGNDVALSGDLTSVQLTVPPTETAESEIGYDDDVPLYGDSTGHELEAAAQEQGHDGDAGLIDNADEIDYDDGDLEQDPEQDNNAAESHAALEASEEQDPAASEVLDQQVLDNTSVQAASSVDRLEADASTHEPSEVAEQEFEEIDSASHAAYPEDSTKAAPGGEVSDVIVTYNGVKYELCASVQNEDPETYFFAGGSEMDLPLSDIFGLLRNVIKDEIEPSDDLIIRVPQLKLEFGESSDKEFLNKHTFRNILDLYRRLKYNDGEDADQAQLVVQLVAKPDCRERYGMLIEAADAGRGWSELFDESDASVISTGETSHEGLDEQQVDFDFGDQSGGNGDDMQHDAVEIIEEAYFYDDTNDAVDHDTDNMFGQVAEDQGHNAEDEDELHEEYDLDGELLENVDFDAEEGKVDDTMGDAHVDGAAPHTYFDGGRGSTPHDRAGSDPFADASDAGNGDAAGTASDGGLDSFDNQAASALGASNALESGNDPLSFSTLSAPAPSHQEFLDDFLERDPQDLTPEMWKLFDALPHSRSPLSADGVAEDEEELIDYFDNDESILDVAPTSNRNHGNPPSDDGNGQADAEVDAHSATSEQDDCVSSVSKPNIVRSIEKDAFDSGKSRAEAGPVREDSLPRSTPDRVEPSSATRKPVCTYRSVSKPERPQAAQQPRSSISPGSAALMMEPQKIAESAFAPLSNRSPLARSGFVLETSFRYSQNPGANFSDPEAHQESAIQHDAGVETAHDPAAHDDDFEDGDGGNFAVNEDSIEFDETASNEPPTGQQIQIPGSHGTSSTSTVDGDEITYEDENVAVGDTINRTLEVGDATAGNVDEIDWEHDGAEDVAAAEEPTNVSSPSVLSIKRGREADDLGSLDDENDAKRRKI